MPRTIERPIRELGRGRNVRPSIIDSATAAPFTLEQELKAFGAWAGAPIWVPPKDANRALAETMLRATRPFASKGDRWAAVLRKHRNEFTQVRELDLFEASIRLPKGKFYVTVVEREGFDRITDQIPRCVQTRLDEFMSGPGKKPGVKVFYLKPLCVEIGDSLSFTTNEDLMAAITKVHEDVFAAYRRLALYRRPWQAMIAAVNVGLAAPRAFMKHVVARRRKAIEAYHARLEFERRKLALEVARTHRKLRTDGCTFDETLALTTPIDRNDVIEQYCTEQELSQEAREQLIYLAGETLPWFVALSLAGSYASALATMLLWTPPVAVCDPAFVAEMPDARGVLLKIGHFDEVGGVTHVEI
ncbi:MAG: hypothetical protein JNL18_07405 [Planctomycetaceae bacterium]|nr:hypothetical protein [Planctomycetaceae bacterium]